MRILIIIAIAIIINILLHVVQDYKKRRKEDALNSIRTKNSRTSVQTEKKTENAILATTLVEMKLPLSFIGRCKGHKQYEEGDIIKRGEDLYVYYKGNWYKIIDDMPKPIKQYYYGTGRI